MFGVDAEGCSRHEFKTSNSAVIASVTDEMKRTLDSKVREIENQIYGKEMIMQRNQQKPSSITTKHLFALHKYFAKIEDILVHVSVQNTVLDACTDNIQKIQTRSTKASRGRPHYRRDREL